MPPVGKAGPVADDVVAEGVRRAEQQVVEVDDVRGRFARRVFGEHLAHRIDVAAAPREERAEGVAERRLRVRDA